MAKKLDEKDEMIKVLKNEVLSLRDEVSTLNASLSQHKPEARSASVDGVQPLNGVSFYKSENGDYILTRLSLDPQSGETKVLSTENLGNAFHLASYKAREIFEMKILLGK